MSTKLTADYFSSDLRLDLANLYGSNRERTEFTLQFYRHLYSLPPLQFHDNVSPELFEYCNKREFFVSVLAFQEKRIFLKRILHNQLLWGLPGSSVRSAGRELFEDAVSRILQSDIPSIEMSELCPIAYLQKTYHCSGNSVTHHGLAYVGRVRAPNYSTIERNENIKGRFVSWDDTQERGRLSKFEQTLVYLGINHLSKLPSVNIEAIDHEIESTDRITPLVHRLHRLIIHPIGRLFSSIIIKRKMLEYVEKGSRVLDIACGDDDFIYQLAGKAKLCVGNDIHWNMIRSLAIKRLDSRKNIIFTNHDACNLPFKLKFDISICKNMLHHMEDMDSLTGLLQSLRNASKHILFVDPEEPKKSGFHARIWHLYYRRLLKDQGKNFYNRNLFEETLKDFYKLNAVLSFDYVRTIKGNFMFCYVDLNPKQPNGIENKRGSEIASDSGPAIRGLIFDLDGLIADTESAFFSAIKEVLLIHRVKVEEQDYIKRDLQNGTSLLGHLQASGLITNKSKIQEEIYSKYREILKTGVKPMPGAKEALERLKADYHIGLASSSKREFIDLILESLNIKNLFEVIIAREDVKRLKPDPECFRLAMEKMSFTANQCLVVEDSLRGVQAAQALGMKVLVIPNNFTANVNYGAIFTLNSLEQLTKELIIRFEN